MVRYRLFIITAFTVAIMQGLPVSSSMSSDTPDDTSISASGDEASGKRIYNRCKACHNLTASKRTRLGPNLDNLFGKKAGAAENYRYSRAMRESDFLWTEAKLDEWLKKPSAFLPGNKMTFAGIRKEKDRKDLIAYMRKATVQED